MIKSEKGLEEVPEGVDLSQFVDGDYIYEVSPEVMEDGSLLVPVQTDDGKIEQVVYVPKDEAEQQLLALAMRVKAAEAKIEELKGELANTEEPPNYAIPCAFCGEKIGSETQMIRSSCCNRVSHVKCVLRTNLRKFNRFPDFPCVHCLIDEAKGKTERYRAQLMAEYNSKPERDKSPPPRDMLLLCMACGVMEENAKWAHHMWKWTQAQVDAVYAAYKELSVKIFIEKGLTVQKLFQYGIHIQYLVRDFGVRREHLLPDEKSQNLSLRRADIAEQQEHTTAFVLAGIDASYMKFYGLDIRKLMEMRLRCEPLCILGFTAIDMILMGLQKDMLPKFSVRQDEWISLLGLDSLSLLLLHLKESDFETNHCLHGWSMTSISSQLRLPVASIDQIFERDRRRQPLLADNMRGSGSGERYGLRVYSHPAEKGGGSSSGGTRNKRMPIE